MIRAHHTAKSAVRTPPVPSRDWTDRHSLTERGFILPDLPPLTGHVATDRYGEWTGLAIVQTVRDFLRPDLRALPTVTGGPIKISTQFIINGAARADGIRGKSNWEDDQVFAMLMYGRHDQGPAANDAEYIREHALIAFWLGKRPHQIWPRLFGEQDLPYVRPKSHLAFALAQQPDQPTCPFSRREPTEREGDVIRQALYDKGLSLGALARKYGLDRRDLGQALRVTPIEQARAAIAAELGLPVHLLWPHLKEPHHKWVGGPDTPENALKVSVAVTR